MNLEIKVLGDEGIADFKVLLSLFEEVFEMENFIPPNDLHLTELLKKSNCIPIVAKLGSEIVGGLTVYVLEQYYSTKPLAYIFDLAVAVKHQRKGIGKELITFTQQYFTERSFEEVFVQADEADEYAIEFYRATKPTVEEDVRHFYYTL